jgi:hypothetical protein
MRRLAMVFVCSVAMGFSTGCAGITAPYHAAKNAVPGSVWVVKESYVIAEGTIKIFYKIGEYAYEFVKAPIECALNHEGIVAPHSLTGEYP